MTTINEILDACNYNITCEYNNINTLTLSLSWKDNIFFNIKWNDKNKQLVSTYEDTVIKIPEFAVQGFTDFIIVQICQKHQFHKKYIKFKDCNPDNYFNLTLSKEDQAKSSNFNYLCKDILLNNISPTHIEIAKEQNIYEPIYQLCQYYLKLSNVNS